MNSTLLSESEELPPDAAATLEPAPEPPVAPSNARVSKARRRVIAKRYRVDELLGEGGMAVVYRGWHLPLDEPIAIKVLKQEYAENEEAVTRFLQEARAGALLRGKSVAQVLDIGRLESGPPFMVTELLQGRDLQELLEARGRLPISTTLRLVKDICWAVAEIHQSGIVHRDLKPANIFIARDRNGSPLIKLLDFGIAKRLDGRDLNDTKHSLGSPHYMAPEQIVSPDAVDVQADIWSLGIVLYELLTGSVPFDADTVPTQCAQVLHAPCPDPCELAPEISPELRAVILRCLEKEPGARYASARELRKALEACEALALVMSGEAADPAPAAEELSVPITVCVPLTDDEPELPLSPSVAPPSVAPLSVDTPKLRTSPKTRQQRGMRLVALTMAACAGVLTLSFDPTRDAVERAYAITEVAAQESYSDAARSLAPHWERWFNGTQAPAIPTAPSVHEVPLPALPRVVPASPEPVAVASPSVAPSELPRQAPAVRRPPKKQLAPKPLDRTAQRSDLINPYPDLALK